LGYIKNCDHVLFRSRKGHLARQHALRSFLRGKITLELEEGGRRKRSGTGPLECWEIGKQVLETVS